MQFYEQGEAALGAAGYELPGWWSRSRTIDQWQRMTGRTALDMHRYEALQVAKVAAIIALGVHLYNSGRAPDPRFASWAAIVPPYVALAVRLAAG